MSWWSVFLLFCLLFSCCFRDCVPGVTVCSLLWALHHRAAILEGWHLRLQEGLVLCRRLLALLSPLDLAALAGLEQLRARGTRNHMLRTVAPPFTHQHLLCALSLHLLSAAAPSAHGLLLWPNPGCSQEGEFILEAVKTTLIWKIINFNVFFHSCVSGNGNSLQ